MKTNFSRIGAIILLALAAFAQPGSGQQIEKAATERIGIYDSRAVAVAYVGSTFHEKRMKDLKTQHEIARRAGDAKEVSRLEEMAQTWQKTLHGQGFGTAPVDDLLAHLASDLPKIQANAGVTSLISKWNKAELAKHPKAVRVDVTIRLIDAFNPNETQRKWAMEVQKKKPVTIED